MVEELPEGGGGTRAPSLLAVDGVQSLIDEYSQGLKEEGPTGDDLSERGVVGDLDGACDDDGCEPKESNEVRRKPLRLEGKIPWEAVRQRTTKRG